MLRLLALLLALGIALPAQAATEVNRRASLADARQARSAPSEPALEAVTTMEATAAESEGDTPPAAGHTRYRFNVPLDISAVPDGVNMLAICRLLNVNGTRRVTSWYRLNGRVRTIRREIPNNENMALGITEVPLRSGTYRGNVKVDIDLPPGTTATPDSYVCQLEYRHIPRGSTLPTGTYACADYADLTAAPDTECVDMVKGDMSSMSRN